MTLALLIALAVLQALDGFTTRRILDQGGRELNPVMRWAFARVGFWPAMAIKTALVPALAWVGGPYAAMALLAIYVVVVANNVRIML